MTLQDIAEWAGSQIQITFYPGQDGRWSAKLKGADIMHEGYLVSAYGNGKSPAEAMADYVQQIVGEKMAIGAYTSKRVEINIPTNLTP